MNEHEIKFIEDALDRLSTNLQSTLSHREFVQQDEDLRNKWFFEEPNNLFSCPNCPDAVPIQPVKNAPAAICPQCNMIVKLDEDQLKVYRFKFDKMLDMIQTQLGVQGNKFSKFKGLFMIGRVLHKKELWQIVFGFSRTVVFSPGTLLELQMKQDAPFTLFLVDKIPEIDESDISVLESCGIFLAKWSDASKTILKQIYQDSEAKVDLRKHLLTLDIHQSSAVVSALRLAATTAAGDPFEEEVFAVCQHLFETAIPFGGSYKGVAIPDGLLTDTTECKSSGLPIFFYDCKSFKGEQFKHKAEIPMQVNYYEDFLVDFFSSDQYENAGFIIFSSSFPDKVRESIEGSTQWRYVQQKCMIYFVDVDSLERVKKLIERYGNSVDRRTFLDICFLGKTDRFLERETQGYYETNFPTSAYSNFRFLVANQFEVAYVAALINAYEEKSEGVLAGLDVGLKRAIRQAQHDKKKIKVRKTVLPTFVEDYIHAIKKGTSDSFLKPLSRLLILNKFEDELRLECGEYDYEEEYESVKDLLDLK